MSEELSKELKEINKQLFEARELYRLSALNGEHDKDIYYRITELETQAQEITKLMKAFYYVK